MINVTGFAKTVPNGTLIKLQYKPLKKHVKLFYLPRVYSAIPKLNKLVMEKRRVSSCLPSREEFKYVDDFSVFFCVL